MLRKPVYENEICVELYALYVSENDRGQKKCPKCSRAAMTVAEAVDLGYHFPDGTSASAGYCKYCGIIF